MTTSFGWTGKILWVNLSDHRVHTLGTREYTPYIGGRGIAARIAWEFLRRGVGALSPENLLMFFTGPLAGTTAPCSGRTVVAGLAPQGYPHEWFTRANLGGHWGPSLKYAGYDGLVIEGKSDHPAYLWIDDARIEVRGAEHLWGMGTMDTQKALIAELGNDVRVLTIGPAGERLSRIATINSETESAAGQGGFGAVMGSKNLKAIALRGTGAVRIALPELFLERCNAISAEIRTGSKSARETHLDPERMEKYGQKWQACTQQCATRCTSSCRYYTDVPGPVTGKRLSGQFHCVSAFFHGLPHRPFYNWKIGFEGGFELRHFSDDYGLNQWDLLLGIIPWLRGCKEAGLIDQIDGLTLDLDDPHFWFELMRRIAFREGIGDALAEGGRRAPALLGFGKAIADELYAGWGSAGHWDGHGDRGNMLVYPFWIVSAMLWAVDTRDPFSSSHDYFSMTMHWSPLKNAAVSWDALKRVAERVYGTAAAVDPFSHYDGKAAAAIWHANRSLLKDSLTLNDTEFPVILSLNSSDGLARADGMNGTDFEYYLFEAATGMDIAPEGLERAAERCANVERAVQVRLYDRSRADDESVIPYFEELEYWQNPLLGERKRLDRKEFQRMMDEFYDRRGWDRTNGRPTYARLAELGLADIAHELGARQLIAYPNAQARAAMEKA